MVTACGSFSDREVNVGKPSVLDGKSRGELGREPFSQIPDPRDRLPRGVVDLGRIRAVSDSSAA